MNIHRYLDQLNGSAENEKIEAARCLAPFTHDARVMDALCAEAARTTSHKVRQFLIDVLKSNPAGAYQRFSNEALWSKDAVVRKWALMNLGLMGCREAKNAVISGLHDPDASVRKAAALWAGLYEDKDVQNVLELFFERHRFDLIRSSMAEDLKALRNRAVCADDDDVSTQTVLI